MTTGSLDDPDLARLVAGFEGLVRQLHRLTTPDGLSLTAASTLYRLGESGAYRVSDLAVAEGVTQPAMTQLVSRLEREGLVRRGSDPTDGRVVVVEVTDAGRRRVADRSRGRLKNLSDLLDGLSADDRAVIMRALEITDRLARRSGDVGE